MTEKTHRVAYITDVFPGITLTFIYLEIKKLREQGFEIEIYAIWPSKENAAETECFREETTYLSQRRLLHLLFAHGYFAVSRPARYLENLKLCLAKHPSLRLYRRTIYNFCLAPSLAMDLARKRISHIHAHFASGAATVAMMASNLLSSSFSFTAHRGDIIDEKVHLREKLSKASFAVAISEYNRRYLLLEAPQVGQDKVKTIYCGVDTNVFLPRERTQDEPVVVLSVGSLIERKGHTNLVEACRLLSEARVDYKCVIVGDGPTRNALENRIRKYSLQDRVLLAGSVPHAEIMPYYDGADIFVLASFSEGIPVVLMEAMSKGLAVVATRITGVPELVTDGIDGILVEPGDSNALANAMIRLSADRGLRKQLGAKAVEKVKQDFDLNKNARKIGQLFEELY